MLKCQINKFVLLFCNWKLKLQMCYAPIHSMKNQGIINGQEGKWVGRYKRCKKSQKVKANSGTAPKIKFLSTMKTTCCNGKHRTKPGSPFAQLQCLSCLDRHEPTFLGPSTAPGTPGLSLSTPRRAHGSHFCSSSRYLCMYIHASLTSHKRT